jgi:hypothetical protein
MVILAFAALVHVVQVPWLVALRFDQLKPDLGTQR